MTAIQIGASARRTRTVTRRDIALFTEITGDRNPIHYDEDLARVSRFGELVVEGGVTSGLLNALVAEQLPGPGIRRQASWAKRRALFSGREKHGSFERVEGDAYVASARRAASLLAVAVGFVASAQAQGRRPIRGGPGPARPLERVRAEVSP